MTVVQAGAINTTALIVPDLYVQIVPPSVSLLNGVPTNVLGVVGTAQWGPVNAPTICSSMADYARQFGAIQARKYDLGTAIAAAVLQGANNFRAVRVTDGSDLAASIAIVATGTAITLSGKYTGSLGNILSAAIAAGSQANTYKLSASLPGGTPEVFDNIAAGVTAGTVTPGTTYTSVPTVSISAPNALSGPIQQAQGSVNLVTYGTPTIGAGGAGYVVGDTITLANGVIVKVLTVSTGAVATFQAQGFAGTAFGSLTAGNVPASPMPQLVTSGIGTGCTVNVTWALGVFTPTVPGAGYTSAIATLTGGGGAGGSIALIATYWGNMALAINNGQSGLRGPSQLISAVAGVGIGAPTIGAVAAFTGGTDGAGAISAATLVGVDTVPRKGMYALRSTGASVAMLADADDSTQWSLQVAYGLSEGVYMIMVGPAGDTIANAVAVKAAAGIDAYAGKLMFGDWIYFNDTVNGGVRVISPQGYLAGLLANLSPEQSSLNKPMFGVVGTQKSYQNLQYSSAELQSLALAGIDVITNPVPGGSYFGARIGHNTSSNAVINGDNYSRMTNYLAYTLNAGMGKFVGQLQSATVQRNAKATISAFLDALWGQNQIGNSQNTAPYSVQIDINNNPQNRVALGYMQADVKVQYLSVIEKFIINLEAGQSVVINRVSIALA